MILLLVILAAVRQQPQLRKQPQNQAPIHPYQVPKKVSEMSVKQLSQWLSNHAEIDAEHYQDDIDKLKGSYYKYFYGNLIWMMTWYMHDFRC